MRKRGAIYFANLPEVGRKRVLVVSWNAVNAGMRPIVARITSRSCPRNIPTYVELHPGEGGMRETSYVLLHELTILPDELIDEDRIGTLSFSRMIDIMAALRRALDLD